MKLNIHYKQHEAKIKIKLCSPVRELNFNFKKMTLSAFLLNPGKGLVLVEISK